MADDESNLEADGGNTGENTDSLDGEVMPPARGGKQNLRSPWQKGQSGNPRGRPKKKLVTDWTERILSKKAPQKLLDQIAAQSPETLLVLGKRPVYAALLAWAEVQTALRGNNTAMERIRNRVEGRVPKEIYVGSDGELDALIAVLSEGPIEPSDEEE